MDKMFEIAHTMYRARTAVIGLIGEEKFRSRVDEYRPILSRLCAAKGLTEMEATVEILTELDKAGHSPLLALAACVEIMEPSLS